MGRFAKIVFFWLCFISSAWASDAINVEINKLPDALDTLVKQNLSILRYQQYAQSSDARLLLLYVQSKNEILEALKPYGYYHASVKSGLTKNTDHQWTIRYKVSLGPQVTIKSVNFAIMGSGSSDPELLKILQDAPLQIGNPFLQDNYVTTKHRLMDAALHQGYFDAVYLSKSVVIDPVKNTADIKLVMNTGERYVFGNTTFSQHSYPYHPAFLSRFLNYQPKEYYQQNKIQALQHSLSNSGYFASVFVSPKPDRTNHTVAVNVELYSKKPQQYSVGLGYGTDTKLRGLAGWDLRHITDSGQHLSLQLQASSLFSSFTVSYIIPGKNPSTDYTSFNATQSYTTVNPYDATQTTAGVDYSFASASDWQNSFGLHQYFITYSTNEISGDNVIYLVPSWQTTFQEAHDLGYWQQGYTIHITTLAALESLASSSSFAQGQINYLYSLPLSALNRIFVNLNGGATAVNDLSTLSPTFRFYAGGVDSVLGYSFLSLGPTDSSGNVIGGRYIGTAQFNFEQHLFDKVSALLYYDVGNAFNSFNSINPAHGWGTGVSWRSPLGSIRLYLSQGLNLPGEPWRVDFSIGAQL